MHRVRAGRGSCAVLAAGWIVLAGCGMGQAEPEAPADADGEGGVSAASAMLTLVDGRTVEGQVALEDGKLVVTPAGGEAVRAGLDALRSLSLRRPEQEGAGQGTPSLLAEALPAPWRSKDLGRAGVPGRARWREGEFVLAAAREPEGEPFPAMHLAYHPLTGDGEIVARVVRIGGEAEDAFAGIILCDGLTPEHRKAMLAVHFHGEGRINFRRWGYQGGSTTGTEDPAIRPPFWLKLVREEFDVKAYYSPDGRRWRFLKEDEGKMRDAEIYVGLVARGGRADVPGEVVIDNVSINGVGSRPAEAMLPLVVLRDGSRLAADVVSADATAFRFGGRWKDQVVTTPQVARVEFFHPLSADQERMVGGERTGLLLRSGDFSEGAFQSLRDGRIVMGSVLFGTSEYSILDQSDALVLREVVEPADPPAFRIGTHAGSVLLARSGRIEGDRVVVEVDGLGEVGLEVGEIAVLERREAK